MFFSDNPMTDVYGANLYNRYLAQQHRAPHAHTRLLAQGTANQPAVAWPSDEPASATLCCQSILVGGDPAHHTIRIKDSHLPSQLDCQLSSVLQRPHWLEQRLYSLGVAGIRLPLSCRGVTTRCSKAATQAPRPGLYTLAVKSYVANKRTAGIGRNPVHTDTKESEMEKKGANSAAV